MASGRSAWTAARGEREAGRPGWTALAVTALTRECRQRQDDRLGPFRAPGACRGIGEDQAVLLAVPHQGPQRDQEPGGALWPRSPAIAVVDVGGGDFRGR